MTARRSDNIATALAFAAIVAVSLMASVVPAPRSVPYPVIPVAATERSGVPVPPPSRPDDVKQPGVHAAGNRVESVGYAGWATRSLGPRYLAMRLPRGTWVTICAVECWTTRTTDYGPSSRIVPNRVADIAVGQWERVCGLPASRGLCLVTVALALAAPETDIE